MCYAASTADLPADHGARQRVLRPRYHEAGQPRPMLPTTPPGLRAQGAILGTLQYMAPEQLEGRETDARTDILAFGAVLHEMVTGRRVFEGRSQASLISAIMSAQPAAVSSLQPLAPTALDYLVARCLAKDVDERWQSAHDLKLQLTWIAEGKWSAPAPRRVPPNARASPDRKVMAVSVKAGTTFEVDAPRALFQTTLASVAENKLQSPIESGAVEETMQRQSRAASYSLIASSLLAGLLLSTTQAAAQQPDLTGVWTTYNEPGQGPGGGRGGGPPLPLTDVAKQKIAKYRALVEPTGDTPGGFCLGTGMPGSMLGSGGYPMEIHQRPEQIMIVYEAHNEVRRVYLGNRIVPDADRLPGRNGHSSGRWEGNTLIVETTHLVEQVDQRYAHSDKARIVERYHLEKGPKGESVLVAEMTMTDPVFYTAPVTAVKKWAQVPNGHLLPYECAEEGWIKHLEELEKKAAGAASSTRP